MKKDINIKLLIKYCSIFSFLINILGPLPVAQAGDFILPKSGQILYLSPAYNPPILKGLKVHPNNPFKFDFILDQGDRQPGDMAIFPVSWSSNKSIIARSSSLPSNQALNAKAPQGQAPDALKQEANKLIKYFLASLTIPEKDLWVNLSPYEKSRIIPQAFGQTDMGRDLLGEDYILKQITASLMYPEGETGKKFWKRIYEEAAKKFGTTNIPVNTFNKVWILPDKAVVYENAKAGTAYVVEARLKVMLEEDYLSMEKHLGRPGDMAIFPVSWSSNKSIIARRSRLPSNQALNAKAPQGNNFTQNIIREIIIPELTKEVNAGANFAQLRQVYNSLILATWYKKKIRDSILAQVYENKNKVSGVLSLPNASVGDPQHIYQRYIQAFKRGAYNYIKEEQDVISHQMVPRKYFSGGMLISPERAMKVVDAQLPSGEDTGHMLDVKMDMAMRDDNDALFSLNEIHPQQVKYDFPLLKPFVNLVPETNEELSQATNNSDVERIMLKFVKANPHVSRKNMREDPMLIKAFNETLQTNKNFPKGVLIIDNPVLSDEYPIVIFEISENAIYSDGTKSVKVFIGRVYNRDQGITWDGDGLVGHHLLFEYVFINERALASQFDVFDQLVRRALPENNDLLVKLARAIYKKAFGPRRGIKLRDEIKRSLITEFTESYRAVHRFGSMEDERYGKGVLLANLYHSSNKLFVVANILNMAIAELKADKRGAAFLILSRMAKSESIEGIYKFLNDLFREDNPAEKIKRKAVGLYKEFTGQEMPEHRFVRVIRVAHPIDAIRLDQERTASTIERPVLRSSLDVTPPTPAAAEGKDRLQSSLNRIKELFEMRKIFERERYVIKREIDSIIGEAKSQQVTYSDTLILIAKKARVNEDGFEETLDELMSTIPELRGVRFRSYYSAIPSLPRQQGMRQSRVEARPEVLFRIGVEQIRQIVGSIPELFILKNDANIRRDVDEEVREEILRIYNRIKEVEWQKAHGHPEAEDTLKDVKQRTFPGIYRTTIGRYSLQFRLFASENKILIISFQHADDTHDKSFTLSPEVRGQESTFAANNPKAQKFKDIKVLMRTLGLLYNFKGQVIGTPGTIAIEALEAVYKKYPPPQKGMSLKAYIDGLPEVERDGLKVQLEEGASRDIDDELNSLLVSVSDRFHSHAFDKETLKQYLQSKTMQPLQALFFGGAINITSDIYDHLSSVINDLPQDASADSFVQAVRTNQRFRTHVRRDYDVLLNEIFKVIDLGNAAMSTQSNLSPTGGIDFSSDRMLSVQNNGQSIDFHVNPAQISQWQKSPGADFRIIGIQPVVNLQEFLSKA